MDSYERDALGGAWTGTRPLTLRHQVPPGRYLLTLLLLSAGDILGHPASMVRIRPAGKNPSGGIIHSRQ